MVVMLVLLTVIGFLSIDYLIQRSAQRREVLITPRSVQRMSAIPPGRAIPAEAVSDIDQLPGGLFLSPWHVWARVEPSGSLRLGVDKVLLAFLGGVDCMYALPEGSDVRVGGPLLMLRNGQRALKIRSPVDGIISSVNNRARMSPQRVMSDPFESGWLYSISPTRLSANLKKMVVAEDASRWMGRELARLRDLLQTSLKTDDCELVTMADGGIPLVGQLSQVENRTWEQLAETYFSRNDFGMSTRTSLPTNQELDETRE
jgi:glycine cleavage system H protein